MDPLDPSPAQTPPSPSQTPPTLPGPGEMTVVDSSVVAPAPSAAKPELCGRCPKRLKLCSRYKCRCGSTFCTAHRLPETHGCNYDFKAAGAAAIAKANPVVVASKLERLQKRSN